MNVKTACGARGDGITDDTAAIQGCISAGLGLDQPDIQHKTLFFPKGTYLISNQLQWKLASGVWSTALTLQGENRDQTIIKLEDSAPGFTDPSNPRAVLFTASDQAIDDNGSGQSAFTNFIFDLTVDVGQGNPGAIGIDYLANNRGAIRNVVVRAPAGSGETGISMTRQWPGPCLLQDVRVVGFGVGIQVAQTEFNITMENIDLTGQRTVGLSNTDDVVSVENLTSTNTVPAVTNTDARGMVTLLGASLLGGSSASAAVVNQGKIYVRALTTQGYQAALSEHGADLSGSSIGEYTTGPIQGLFPPNPQQSLNLPIATPPSVVSGPPSGWASIADYGAKPEPGGFDNTAAIQAALNSGHATVYFPPGAYVIDHPLTVPQGVEILGFNSTLRAVDGDFATPNAAYPVLRFTGNAGTTTVVRQLYVLTNPGVPEIVDSSAGTLFLQDVQLGMDSLGYQNEPGAGPLFLDDVDGGIWNFAYPQNVWARQLDPESPTGPKISNNGGNLWIFGLKTERPTTVLVTSSGGSTELLGGFLSPTEAVPANTPAFVSTDSRVSLSYLAQTTPYPVQVQETQSGITRMLTTTPGSWTLMPLYTG